jgi:hypothetical protein
LTGDIAQQAIDNVEAALDSLGEAVAALEEAAQ